MQNGRIVEYERFFIVTPKGEWQQMLQGLSEALHGFRPKGYLLNWKIIWFKVWENEVTFLITATVDPEQLTHGNHTLWEHFTLGKGKGSCFSAWPEPWLRNISEYAPSVVEEIQHTPPPGFIATSEAVECARLQAMVEEVRSKFL